MGLLMSVPAEAWPTIVQSSLVLLTAGPGRIACCGARVPVHSECSARTSSSAPTDNPSAACREKGLSEMLPAANPAVTGWR